MERAGVTCQAEKGTGGNLHGSFATTQPSSAACTETSTPTLQGIVVLSPSFPPRRLLPTRPSHCRLSLRFPLIPTGGSPESNYVSQGSAIHPSGLARRGRGVEEPRRTPLPRRPGLWAPAAPGGVSTALEGHTAPPPGLFVLPRGHCGPEPKSTRLSGRRLTKGFPRRAPPANRRRAGGARGPRTRAFQNPRLIRTSSPPRTLFFPPRLPGSTRAAPRGLFLSLGLDRGFWAPRCCSPK